MECCDRTCADSFAQIHDETDAKSLDTRRKSGLLLKLAQEKAVAAAETLKSEDKMDDAVKTEEIASSPSVAASANEDTVMSDATEPSTPVVAQPIVVSTHVCLPGLS